MPFSLPEELLPIFKKIDYWSVDCSKLTQDSICGLKEEIINKYNSTRNREFLINDLNTIICSIEKEENFDNIQKLEKFILSVIEYFATDFVQKITFLNTHRKKSES